MDAVVISYQLQEVCNGTCCTRDTAVAEEVALAMTDSAVDKRP